MLFYFIRHGETDANRRRVLAGGGLDPALTQVGHAQARGLAAVIRNVVHAPIHRLIASNMTRTRQTAGYISETLGLPLQLMPEWREWHLGEWEGHPFSQFGHLILGDGEPEQGESRQAFYARVEDVWRKHHSASEPYIIVSHGAVWLALQDILHIPRFEIHNCQLVKVLLSPSGQWQAEILEIK